MAPSKAIATRAKAPAKKSSTTIEQADIVLDTIPTIEQVIQALEEKSHFWVDDSDAEPGESMLLSKLRNSKNAEDLAKETDLDSVKDRLGEWLLIQTIDAVRNSDFKDSTFHVYLVVTATSTDGELVKLGVGATEPFATIVAWREMGELPRWIKFDLAEKATKGGFFPVNVTDGGRDERPLVFAAIGDQPF
jgi:hypothetical protein